MHVLYQGIDSPDKLGVQAQSCAERAAVGPGEPLARPWRDTQSEVSRKKHLILKSEFSAL